MDKLYLAHLTTRGGQTRDGPRPEVRGWIEAQAGRLGPRLGRKELGAMVENSGQETESEDKVSNQLHWHSLYQPLSNIHFESVLGTIFTINPIDPFASQ